MPLADNAAKQASHNISKRALYRTKAPGKGTV